MGQSDHHEDPALLHPGAGHGQLGTQRGSGGGNPAGLPPHLHPHHPPVPGHLPAGAPVVGGHHPLLLFPHYLGRGEAAPHTAVQHQCHRQIPQKGDLILISLYQCPAEGLYILTFMCFSVPNVNFKDYKLKRIRL